MTSNLRRGGRAIGVVLMLAVGGIVAGVVGTVAAGVALRSLVSTVTPTMQLSFFAVPMFMFFVVGAVYLRYRGLPLDYVGVRVPSLRDLLWTVGGYVSAIALIMVASVILAATRVQPDAQNSSASFGLEHPELMLWMVPLMIFVVGPCEEFLFRGVIQNRLKETFVTPVAIVVTAVVFAVLHVVALTGDSAGIAIAISILFFPSLVFGVVYEKTENLVTNALIHGFYNSTLILLLYISVVYGDMDPSQVATLL